MIKINDYDFLKEQEIYYIVPWIMPMDNNQGSAKVNNQKGRDNGLTFRPLKESITDTLDWWNSDLVGQETRDKYLADPNTTLAREQELLEKWSKR